MTELLSPPEATEAEKALITAVLLSPKETLDRAADLLPNAEAFADAESRKAWEIILQTRAAGLAVDEIVLMPRFAEAGLPLSSTGGLVGGVIANPKHARTYALEIRSAYLRRMALNEFRDLSQYATTERDANAFLRATSKAFDALQRLAPSTGGAVSGLEALDAAFSEVEASHRGEDVGGGVLSGLPGLDALLGGVRPTELCIVAGQTGRGKTAFALNWALAAIKAGTPVLFFSLEMDSRSLMHRMLSAESGVPLSEIRPGAYRAGDRMREVTEAKDRIKSYSPLRIVEASSLVPETMATEARRFVGEHGPAMIVLDYLQLLEGGELSRRKSQFEVVSENSRKLKVLAGELGCPILCLSQMSRAAKDAKSDAELLGCLRSSGSIEQDANSVIVLHEPSKEVYSQFYAGNHYTDREATLIALVKHRRGQAGTIPGRFRKAIQKFEDESGTPEAPQGGRYHDPAPAAIPAYSGAEYDDPEPF